MLKKNKVIFMGTPKIAAVCLEAILLLPNIEIVGVVCQIDKKEGRKQSIIFSPVKKIAISHNLNILQDENVNNLYEKIKNLKPDLIFTCAFGQFLSNKILVIPKYHCINLHASLLPKLRGGAPIQWAIINEYSKTGFTLMHMSSKMDAGNIIKQYEIEIAQNETYISLYEKFCVLANEIIRNDFMLLFNKNIKSIQQVESDATFANIIYRKNERINWNKSASQIDALIRGLYKPPCAYTTFENKIIKIHHATIINNFVKQKPGTIISINKFGIQVATNDNKIINFDIIQIEGKKPCHVNQLLNGKNNFVINKLFV